MTRARSTRSLRRLAATAAGLVALGGGALVAAGGPASARVPDLVTTPALYTVNTDTLTLRGPGAAFRGTASGSVATFSFRAVDIRAGSTLRVRGHRAFRLVAATSLRVAGRIDGNGASGVDFVPGVAAGGPGGGAGGSNASRPGQGPGGGGAVTEVRDGGGGGGYGGRGARGGIFVGHVGPGGAGGVAYGDLDRALQGGSGGAGGGLLADVSDSTGGGGGGGALELRAATLTVTVSGVVQANGGSGASGDCGGSGGGSGGAVRLRATVLDLRGTVSVRGGDGGVGGGDCGDGGGGAGGRVSLHFQRILSGGFVLDGGGRSGSRSTTGASPGVGKSPDAFGERGAFARVLIPDTVVTRSSIRPSRHRATFRFNARFLNSSLSATRRVTGFQCAVHKVHRRAKFRACASARTYRRLERGRYVFEVRAIGPAGADPVPARKRFGIG